MAIPFEPNTAPIVFQRLADERMRERAFLERLAGTYTLPSMIMIATVQGDHTLVLGYTGQPTLELVPLEGTRFTLKGQPSITVEFDLAEAGPASGLELTHPGGIMTATRSAD